MKFSINICFLCKRKYTKTATYMHELPQYQIMVLNFKKYIRNNGYIKIT